MAIRADTRLSPAGATSDQALDTRAHAWGFIFDCYAKKETAPESRPDDAERRSSEIGAKPILPRG